MTRKRAPNTDPSATVTRRRPTGPATDALMFERQTYVQRLMEETIACRVMHEKLGTRRALAQHQVTEAAEVFDAEPGRLSASKRIIDTTHPAYRACTQVRRDATQYWKDCTIPYPEPGVRLLRRSRIDEFTARMTEFRTALDAAAVGLQAAWTELRAQAREALGELFAEDDYPENVAAEFAIEWDFPSTDPPEYLRRLQPALYEAEKQRIQSRFAEAVTMTEQAFVGQFQQLVTHLVERLTGGLDGKPKTFRESTVENLREFFADFRKLDIGSSAELRTLVDQADRALGGATAEELRDNAAVSAALGAQLGQIATSLDSMMIERPKRSIRLGDDGDAVASPVVSEVAA